MLHVALGRNGLYRTLASTFVSGGTAAPEARISLRVSPNPSDGRASVTVVLAQAAPVTVSVFDAFGRRVARLHDGPAAGTLVFPIPEALPPGVYVVRASGTEQAVTQRLVAAC